MALTNECTFCKKGMGSLHLVGTRVFCSDLCWIKANVRENQMAGRQPYEGLSSDEISRYNRALMFGDNDEAFPSQAEWSRITD